MIPWVIKAVVQQIIGRLPKSYWWNEQFQKYITKGYYPSLKTLEDKLGCCRQHIDNYLKFSPSPRSGFRAIELGTGQWPIVPLGLYLCGAADVWTFDLAPLVRQDTLMAIFKEIGENKGCLERILGTVHRDRLLRLEKLSELAGKEPPAIFLRRMNIYLSLGDAEITKLPDNSFDLIFSNVVLELIISKTLRCLLAEFKRKASPDAVMSHYVGLADQYASFDKSITPYNFLKYSERQWRFLNNPIIPQNRMCIADYRKLFEQAGWGIVEERNISGSLDDLKKIELAPKFREYTTEDLLVLFSWLVARPLKS